MSILKGLKRMAKEFVDEMEKLLGSIPVANPDQLKADVLAAMQPHLDTLDAAEAATKAEADETKAAVDSVKSDVVDLQQVIKDALQHLADGKPVDAENLLKSAVPVDTGTAA